MDGSMPGSSGHGILQARILEWVAMPTSRGSSQPRDWTHISCLLHWQALPLAPPGKPSAAIYCPWKKCLATYQDFLKTGSHRSWACNPPYSVAHYALSYGNSTSPTQHSYGGLLNQDATTPGPCDMFYLQEGMASSVLSPLPDSRVLEEVTPPPGPWLPGKPLGINCTSNNRLCK